MLQCLLPDELHYDGSQLRTDWVAEVTGGHAEAIVAFQGSCDVSPEHMIDTEDLELGHVIRAQRMLHFIVQHPGIGLDLAVARQRLLACLARDLLAAEHAVAELWRYGDDLYVGRPPAHRKLSISVATASPTCGLIHFAVNIDPAGAPVPAIGLTELQVDPERFGVGLLEAYATEMSSCARAARKVRPAR
ncbi:MAG: DUF366 family protein [Armatimonadetes bacterium]|nr:DUF366 family protein [Armatimonadota bacterium]